MTAECDECGSTDDTFLISEWGMCGDCFGKYSIELIQNYDR